MKTDSVLFMQKADSEEKLVPRVHFAALALVSFLLSFVVARSFTYFYPGVVFVSGNLHIHHFWFGIALLAIGGWLGISYNHKEIDRLAAIIYGVGGGIIADEVGLLLTFGDYWSGITWTFVIVLVASVSALILLGMHRRAIFEELHDFVSNKASLYIGIFLAAISIAIVVETDNLLITVVFAGLTVAAILMIITYFTHRMRTP
jgi:hypothetical protein